MTPERHERTAEEREQARREREARRAARERGEKPDTDGSGGLLGGLLRSRGSDEPPEPEPPVAEPPPEPAAPAEQPLPAAEEPPVPAEEPPAAAEEPPAAAEEPVQEPSQPPAPVEPAPPVERPAEEPPAAEPVEPLTSEPPLPLHEDPAEFPPAAERPLAPPAPVRRAGRDRAADRAAAARVAIRARRKREQGGAPPQPPRGRPNGGAGDDGGRRRIPTAVLRAGLGVGLVLLLVAGWFAWSLFQPLKGDGEGEARVAIPTGATVTQIADILEENDVVSNAFFFRLRVTLGGNRGDLKPGSYTLRRDMSYAAAIDALSEGPPRNIVSVTIPEGRARSEIRAVVEEAGLDGNYVRASRSSDELNPRRYGATNADSLEGFLFPATYELDRGASARDLVDKQLETFKREFADVNLRPARRRNLSPYDVLIIASMVEREAAVAEERPVIASVIYNRLSAGMPLGIDATIRFALNNWEQPLRESELQADTPYNTRTNAGLPPGPIGNPGIDSIKAAANPADTDYLYFVVKPGGCGEHVFTETFEEFQRDAQRYEAERERRGGRSPTDC